MTGARFGLKRWVRASPLGLALALGVCLAAGAQPASVPRPVPANRGDPIGALLARQGLADPAANIPMVIGLKLGESAARSRFLK